MALIVFLRGVNVGGHRTFRPSLLAQELSEFDAVNIGAAGTLVIRRPGARARFIAELRARLPFEVKIALCDGKDLLRLADQDPFYDETENEDTVRFVSILCDAGSRSVPVAFNIPDAGPWGVRIKGRTGRLVYGVYRRNMKAIGYLGHIDRIFGTPATTRNWNTILSIVKLFNSNS